MVDLKVTFGLESHTFMQGTVDRSLVHSRKDCRGETADRGMQMRCFFAQRAKHTRFIARHELAAYTSEKSKTINQLKFPNFPPKENHVKSLMHFLFSEQPTKERMQKESMQRPKNARGQGKSQYGHMTNNLTTNN